MLEKTVKILITGVNGFIGKNVAHELYTIMGVEIIGVSVEESCSFPEVKSYEQGDISDFVRMEAIFEKHRPDIVIHLAAIVHKKSLNATYEVFYKVNYLSSENIFKLCRKYNVRKLLYSSTVEVYDMCGSKIICEASEALPLSDYGKTKLMAEQALITLAESSEMNYAVMRFAPVYGDDFTLNLDRRIYLVKGKLLYFFGDGSYFYNMCSILNVVDFVKAFIAGSYPSGVYNISDTKNYSVKELVAFEKMKAAQKNGKKAPVSIRLPFYLTYIAIAIIEETLKIFNRKSIISVYNFRKIFRCTVFDNTKAARIVGGIKWDIVSTLYGGGAEHEENT